VSSALSLRFRVSEVCGLVFEIYPLAHDQAPTTNVRLGFQVDDVDGLVPFLVRAGGSVIAEPRDVDGGRRAVVRDPDGHRIEMFTPSAGHKLGTNLGGRAGLVGSSQSTSIRTSAAPRLGPRSTDG
jgi:hypothetical protein